MKDVKKMQKPMKEEGYIYCSRHDIYYDEWLKCPACELETIHAYISDIEFWKKQTKELVEKFNPNNRD